MKYRNTKTRAGSLCVERDACGVKRDTQYAIRNTTYDKKALTLLEMVIAMAIMVIVFAALLPQFRAILNSWDSKAAAAEVLQNARVLIDHLNRNLTEAAQITAVSDFTETVGFIEFEDNVGDRLRYDVDANNYVQFGSIGSLAELAGPVSQLQFTCYDAFDLDTPLSPITDANDIRFVKIVATLTNPAAMGRDMTFTAQTYIRTKPSPCTEGLIGWWKLDETSGLSAADSSGQGNDGTLNNMAGDEWTTGQIGGALDFDGGDDNVEVPDDPSFDIADEITVTAWINPTDASAWRTILSKFASGARKDIYWYLYSGRIGIALAGPRNSDWTTSITIPTGSWIHVAATYDGSAIRMYKNGVNEDTLSGLSGTLMLADSSSNQSFYIGRNTVWGEYFRGTIDDVRIYSRALSTEEISQLANILRYEEFTKAKASSDTTSVTISTPSGTSEGDLLIAAVATDGDTSASLAPPGGEGWTEIDIDDRSGEVTLGAWWKNADASESPSHQFTWSASEQAYAWMMRFTGHDATDPIDVWEKDRETSSTPTSPAVTTTVDGCLILRLGGFDDDDITVGDPGLSGHVPITMDATGSAGLVGWWKLDETSGLSAADSSGQGNDGTLNNMAGDEWTTGQIDGALDFDGGNDNVEVADDPSFDIADEITVTAWINPTDASAWRTILSKFASGARKDIYWYLCSGRIGIALAGPRNSDWTTSITIPTGSWIHVAATYDGSSIRMYKNGVNEDTLSGLSGTLMLADSSSNQSFYIGRNTVWGEYFDGIIDDVRVYNGALSAGEVTALYNGEEPGGGGGGVVSGGAGYVRQSAAGDSGTSDFSLTASEESVTLTVAIAPNPASGGGCGGEILP